MLRHSIWTSTWVSASRQHLIRNILKLFYHIGLPTNHEESYHYFMWENFFKHIDILSENVHILNGNASDLSTECVMYENKIKAVGGIDLFIGGKKEIDEKINKFYKLLIFCRYRSGGFKMNANM